jgi:DNA-binding transcriptional ArsR family regulator
MVASKQKRAAHGDLDRTLAALADPQRRRAIELLGERPLASGELARALDLSAPAMSRHLRVLRESGLVQEAHPDYDARVKVYSLRASAMTGLKVWLDRTEKLWAQQLGAFKAHLEKR